MDVRIVDPLVDGQMSEAFAELLPDDYMLGARGEYFIGAVNEDDEAVGILAFRNEPDRYKITYIYVEDDSRREGVATMLVNTLLDFIEDTDQFMDVEAEFAGTCVGLRDFFDDHSSFDLHKMSATYFVTPEEIANSDNVRLLLKKKSTRDIGFFELSKPARLEVLKSLAEDSGYIVNDYSFWEQNCEKDLCRCILNDKNEVVAVIIVEKKDEDLLSLSYLKSNNPLMAIEVIGALVQRYVKGYIGCTMMIKPVSDSGDDVFEKLLSKTGTKSFNYIAEWNYLR